MLGFIGQKHFLIKYCSPRRNFGGQAKELVLPSFVVRFNEATRWLDGCSRIGKSGFIQSKKVHKVVLTKTCLGMEEGNIR